MRPELGGAGGAEAWLWHCLFDWAAPDWAELGGPGPCLDADARPSPNLICAGTRLLAAFASQDPVAHPPAILAS